MRLEFVGRSDIGRKRGSNQDAYGAYTKEDAGLFVLADGMGGHANGEKASQIVVAELTNWWQFFSPAAFGFEFRRMTAAVEQVIAKANKRIYTEYNQKGICGTTVTVLFIFRKFYAVIYAGDSRCYLSARDKKRPWRGRTWTQLTVDEVWENQSGISEKERAMQDHPNRGKLVNAVGTKENIRCRAMTDMIVSDSVFLLCSDGLYKFCDDGFIRDSVRKSKDRESMKQSIDSLIDKVYENGAYDNISIVMVKCFSE